MDSLQYRIVQVDPPRYHGGKRPSDPLGIIIHCTAGDTASGAISWLNRILKNGEHGKASYNYIIEKGGAICRMAKPDIIAYHAGLSSWPTLPSRFGSLNHCTIGIAFANDNGSDDNPLDDALTIAQLESCMWLCATFCRQYSIPVKHILGHIEVSPGRKFDPLPAILDMNHWRSQVKEYMIEEDLAYFPN